MCSAAVIVSENVVLALNEKVTVEFLLSLYCVMGHEALIVAARAFIRTRLMWSPKMLI